MSDKRTTAPSTKPLRSERAPQRPESNEEATLSEPSTSPADAAPGTAIPAESLLELLQQSAQRTERALGPDEGSAPSSRGITRSGGAAPSTGFKSPDPDAASARRLQSNPAEAVERRLRRLGVLPEPATRSLGPRTESADGGTDSRSASRGLGLERIIGRNMLMEVKYLEAGEVAARSVGRVIIRDDQNRSLGYGTGFLVAPGLLLTNNHVLSSAAIAGASQVEFNYQRGLDGRLDRPTVFNLEKDRFFVTSPVKELDFTLVAVAERSVDGRPIDAFGYLPLSAVADEVLAGECVTIIQHPKGEPKQVALRKNEVIRLPEAQESFLHYQTDTNPGSSGSPVFNDGWEVVALHHSGKPAVDSKGNYLTEDGTVWSPDMGLDGIKWLANEGVRVAAIVKFLRERELTESQKALLAPALASAPLSTPGPERPTVAPPRQAAKATTLSSMPGTPVEGASAGAPSPTVLLSSPAPSAVATPVAPPTVSSPVRPAALAPDGSVSITIPLEVTVRLLAPTAQGTVAGTAAAPAPTLAAEEKIQIDPDYGTREGYDPEFLGAGDLAVPMPTLTPALEADAAINRQAGPEMPGYELPYHHFSVVLNRKRRLAYFTAVNIDGRNPLTEKREADRWYFDPRVDQTAQVGNDFYKGTVFDRGHLVRRLDPAWGRGQTISKAANDDTFHFSNCSPQHKNFNEGKNLWAGLEDYLLKTAGEERRRITVFTGPVFARGDQVYRGLPIPKKFWKVAVTVRKGGRLNATAYVVDQEDLIRPLFEAAPEELDLAALARTFQVQVRKVEQLTGLDFGHLRDCDPTGKLDLFEATEQAERELEDFGDIIL